MLQIPAKRKNEKYDLALFKEGNKILTLFKNNSLVYVNTESIEETQKNKDHFQMLLLNAIYFEITIKGGSSYMYIQGNYVVRYYLDGKTPPEDPEPLSFSVGKWAKVKCNFNKKLRFISCIKRPVQLLHWGFYTYTVQLYGT